MPELPEVETIRREAQEVLKGLKIKRVKVLDPKPVKSQKRKFEDLKGSIKGVRRFGKILVIDLVSKKSILVHLKMTGQLVYEGRKKFARDFKKGFLEMPNKYTRLIFYLNKGKLYFSDLRKFGYLKLVATKNLKETPEIKNLGLEPLDKGFNSDFLQQVLEKTKRPVKIVLMDQRKIAGVGNIYANEALFWAKVRPQRPANTLTKRETKQLVESVRKVIKEGIALKGASENTYVDLFGAKGSFMKKVMVYQRAGKRCHLCGARIKKIVLGGRSSFYCPKCQR